VLESLEQVGYNYTACKYRTGVPVCDFCLDAERAPEVFPPLLCAQRVPRRLAR